MNSNISKKSIKLAKKLIFYQLVIAMLAGFLVPFNQVLAVTTVPLTISNITITQTDNSATITWRMNRPAFGKIEYGIYTNDYNWEVNTNQKTDVQAITISGLFPETDYFFRITADDETSEVISFEQRFETLEQGNNKSPLISGVQAAYLTGTTATIQWFTDEDATSEIEYGLTTNYGSTKSDGRRVKIHDVTISGLVDGTTYQFRVKSKDKDNNVSIWYNMSFRTKFGTNTDLDELIVYNIEPSGENFINVKETTAVISWRTNKLAEGSVRYGETTSYGKTIYSNPPRDFTQDITLINLKPGTTYYFAIEVKDVFGKTAKSNGYSFVTKSSADDFVPGEGYFNAGEVLGTTSCSIDSNTAFGFYGLYYNLTSDHPDFDSWKTNKDIVPPVGRQNDWYNSEYFSFSQIDSSLRFGSKFLPVDEGKLGDPFGFAVNWRSIINVPETNTYNFSISSDDDSWLLIDDKVVINFGGFHSASESKNKINLSAGFHKLEIFYAERQSPAAAFTLNTDSRLKFHPLPDGCDIDDIDNNNQTEINQPGQVLGVKQPAPAPAPAPAYACNPDLGYTRITDLYKTTNSPDIWAILETGQKHYITSPAAFNKYQCDWSRIRTVSQTTLNSYDSATLVRTPENATIYHLFQRPERQWLRINIPSPTVFITYPNNFWGNVARLDALDLNSYPDVRLMKAIGLPEVYLIEGSLKRHIKTEAAFEGLGYDWAEVVEINEIHLDSYEDGLVID
ncbi:MAG: hypothetical protein CMI53_02270 [Parcubacteria group bacterium]|nr:hypothetical protein [Parcubacteria group bacterium]